MNYTQAEEGQYAQTVRQMVESGNFAVVFPHGYDFGVVSGAANAWQARQLLREVLDPTALLESP